jgi:hypothetical protein
MVSWKEAREILERLRPFVTGFQSEYAWAFAEMLRAVACEGGASAGRHSASIESE